MPTTTFKSWTLPTQGGNSGTWGNDLNNNPFASADKNLGGIVTKSLSNVNVTLTASESENLILRLTGTLTGNVQITTSAQGVTLVENATSGAFSVTINYTGGIGTPVTVPQGILSLVTTDATNGPFLLAIGSATLSTLTVTGAATFNSTASIAGKLSLTSTDSLAVAKGTTGQRNGSPTEGDMRWNSTTHAEEGFDGTLWRSPMRVPTFQKFTSGSGSYTPATGVTYIQVRMVAGGGGGGAAATNNGSTGGTTSFGSWTAIGGGGGTAGTNGASSSGPGGAGGTGGVNGTGTLIVRIPGTIGTRGNASTGNLGGAGGSGLFGGGAPSSMVAPVTGADATINTGGGGAGGGASGSGAGGGGGSGEYVEFLVSNPGVLAYAVGAIGSGGTAGVNAGGNGAAGIIIIEEFYS